MSLTVIAIACRIPVRDYAIRCSLLFSVAQNLHCVVFVVTGRQGVVFHQGHVSAPGRHPHPHGPVHVRRPLDVVSTVDRAAFQLVLPQSLVAGVGHQTVPEISAALIGDRFGAGRRLHAMQLRDVWSTRHVRHESQHEHDRCNSRDIRLEFCHDLLYCRK